VVDILVDILVQMNLETLLRYAADDCGTGSFPPRISIAGNQIHIGFRFTKLYRKTRQCSAYSPRETDTPMIMRLPSGSTPLEIQDNSILVIPSV